MTLFNELVLISLKKQDSFSRTPSAKEWQEIYAEAEKQSLIGVCFSGIERLSQERLPDMDLLMDWLGQTEYIKSQNEQVSQRAAEVTRLFAEGNFRSVVLKGQGVAQLYTHPELRTSGDVDLWVDGKRQAVIDFMKRKGWKVSSTVVHHSDVEVFPDVSVEVHYYPSYTYSPFRWRKYRKWFDEQNTVQMQLLDKSLGYAYPSVGFNTVYSLLHIFRHVFHEGIGLRQLLDYYYILMHTDAGIRREAMKTLRWFGLEGFAGAVMYVEKEFFHLDDEHLLCEPSVESGKFLLNEIITVGNFGKYDERVREAHKGGDMRLYVLNVKRLMKMLRFYPAEVLWAPIWKPVHQLWRWSKGY